MLLWLGEADEEEILIFVGSCSLMERFLDGVQYIMYFFKGVAVEILLFSVVIMDAIIVFSSRVYSFIDHPRVWWLNVQMRIKIFNW